MNYYEPYTYSLLEPILGDEFILKSLKTGKEYKATDEQTMLIIGDTRNIDPKKKYANSVRYGPYDITNLMVNGPCPECKRVKVTCQMFGDDKAAVFSCLCGAIWTLK